MKMDYSNIKEGGGLVPEGDYEVVIKSAFIDATPSGTIYINIPLIIRNDIEQPYKNAYIWHALWQKKTPTKQDEEFDGFSSAQIFRLCNAAGIPSDAEFKEFGDILEVLAGKLLRVTLYHDEYNGKTNAKVKFTNVTQHADCKHVFKVKDPVMTEGEEIPISDDDLPF